MSTDTFVITSDDLEQNQENILSFLMNDLKNKKFDFSFVNRISESYFEDYLTDSFNDMTMQLKELKGFDYQRLESSSFSMYHSAQNLSSKRAGLLGLNTTTKQG